MFDKVLGIPAHPLLIHAAVVFIPLLIGTTIAYAWWPAARARLDWAVAGLAVASPFSAWFAKLSGEAFRRRLIHDRVSSPAVLAKIAQHQSYGTATLWWTIGLSLVALALVYYGWRPPSTIPPSLLLGAAVVATVLGLIVGYYVFRTGDTGAHIAWSGY